MTQLIDRKKIKPHPHNKMWGKPQSAVESMKMVLSTTKDVEPIRVCKDLGNWIFSDEGDYLILSGHSRFEVNEDAQVECKVVECESEEEQVLRLIAYNAGHSTHPDKLVAAANYCHKHFPLIAIESIMDAAGIVDNRAEWKEALELSVKAVEGASPKHRKRTSDSIVAAAEKGPKAITETASRSISQKGTKSAEREKSPLEETAPKPLEGKDLTAENGPIQGGDFKKQEPVPVTQKDNVSTSSVASVETLRKKLVAEYRALIRKHDGAIPEGPVREASSFLIQFLEGKTPERPSQLSTAILESQLAKEKDEHKASINSVDAAIVMINEVFKKHMANTRNGEVFVPAHAISYAMISNGFESVNDMDPEVLASRMEPQ